MPRTNGLSNGHNGDVVAGSNTGRWTVGLINATAKYLTAETFGFKINANGNTKSIHYIWYS